MISDDWKELKGGAEEAYKRLVEASEYAEGIVENLSAMLDRADIIEREIEAAAKKDGLSEEEWNAVYDWINREKDSLPSPLKEGLLKLVNAEARRQ